MDSNTSTSPDRPASHTPQSFRRGHWLTLAALALIYALYTLSLWSRAYIDFGDGNYIYIAKRIAEGAVVYRDILAPQPPCHLFLGAVIARAMRHLPDVPIIYGFRLASLCIHLACFGFIVALARRAWGCASTAVAAGAIYLWLPIGFWWALGYQSEPLEILFLLAMMFCALRGTVLWDIATGLMAALAGLTNATAAPFLLVLIIYMLIRAPRRAAVMTAPCLIVVGIVTVLLQVWTDGQFLENTVFNQVGTYPRENFLHYAIFTKLLPQSGKVLALEGFFLFAALIGFWRYLRSSPMDPLMRDGLGWFMLATLGSIIYVTKGGTVDYIFSLSEPAVAILAAGELAAWARRWPAPGDESGRLGQRMLMLCGALMLVLFATAHALSFQGLLRGQEAYECSEDGVEVVRYQIRLHSGPDDRILASPYYAVDAGRRLWGDYSEIFIWTINYWNDREANNPDGPGWSKIRAMSQAILDREIPIVILEMKQTGRIPEVMTALMEAYEPIRPDRQRFLFRTLNLNLGFFVPVEDGNAARKEGQAQAWARFKREMIEVYGADGTARNFGMWYDQDPAPAPAEQSR